MNKIHTQNPVVLESDELFFGCFCFVKSKFQYKNKRTLTFSILILKLDSISTTHPQLSQNQPTIAQQRRMRFFILVWVLTFALFACSALAHMDEMSPGRLERVRLPAPAMRMRNHNKRSAEADDEEMLVLAPWTTEGPYFATVDDYADNADLTAEAVAIDRRAVLDGVPLTLTLNVFDVANGTGTAMAGASVFLWHCDSKGVYGAVNLASASTNKENTVGQKWLRSVQPTDEAGQVVFQTIVPGWYAGRTLHFHLRVRAADAATDSTFVITTQLMFRDSVHASLATVEPYKSVSTRYVTLAEDMIYTSAAASVGDGLLLDLQGSLDAGFAATFSLGIDRTVTGGTGGGGGPRGPGGMMMPPPRADDGVDEAPSAEPSAAESDDDSDGDGGEETQSNDQLQAPEKSAATRVHSTLLSLASLSLTLTFSVFALQF